ncbi:MAG: hypothetical protein HYY51_01765 [Candidatus Magasanikbacteria bacterium]|nr:hypothetical protein [Candidatus Magasanikbacteria bacterium]
MDQSQPMPAGSCQACAGVEGATHTCGMKTSDGGSCSSCGHDKHKDGDGTCGSCDCATCSC